MLLAVIFAHVWGVLQLLVLGSFAKTTRTRTVLAAMAVGFFACAPLAVLLQVTWIRAAASLSGAYIGGVVQTASYTFDPFMEEALKVLPLLLLLRLPAMRRQCSITDCVLIAAATGSGFGLAEFLYAVGTAPSQATPIEGGWILGIGLWLPVVPSMWTSIHAWLPSGAGDTFLASGATSPNLHLAWAAVGGLAVGLVLRLRAPGRWIAAVVLFLYIGLDHAAVNAEIKSVGGVFSTVFSWLRTGLRLLPIAALAVAWMLDRRRWQRAATPYAPRLTLEESTQPRVLGTLRAALSHAPWSLLDVLAFVRVRRAYGMARADGAAAPELAAIVTNLRDGIERRLASAGQGSASAASDHIAAWARSLRRPAVLIWIALALPPFLWFVAGGWPQTAGVQRVMTSSIAWPIVVLLSAAAQAWLVWQLVVMLRLWPRIAALPVGDETAVFGLRAICGLGAVSLGGYALTRAFTGLSPSMNVLAVHASEAFARTPLDVALMTGAGGIYTIPPGARPPSAADPWRAGYDIGRRGRTPQDFDGATPAYQASYDAGYHAGQAEAAARAEAAATTDHPGIRQSPPEEWIHQRVIPTLSPDGVGAQNIEYKGTPAQLDAIQAREAARLRDAQLDGLATAFGGFRPEMQPDAKIGPPPGTSVAADSDRGAESRPKGPPD